MDRKSERNKADNKGYAKVWKNAPNSKKKASVKKLTPEENKRMLERIRKK